MYLTEFNVAEGVNIEVEGGKESNIVASPLAEKSIRPSRASIPTDYLTSGTSRDESGTLGAWYILS